jgi:transketolase
MSESSHKSQEKVRGFTWTVGDHALLSDSDAWGEALVEAGRADPRIVTVTADLGETTRLQAFKRAMPERAINVGIAEQNLIAVAAGLAATGLIPVVCTYATFAVLRAAEFVRTDLGYAHRNVKLIGTLAGVAYGQGGPSHHAAEDLALLRAIPGLVILAPSDGYEMAAALRAALAHDGPVYLRWGRGTERVDPARRDRPFVIGPIEERHPGADVTVLAYGPTVQEAERAARRALAAGVSARVLAVPTLAPLERATILRAARETRRLITVEDHSIVGGLASAVAETVARAGIAARIGALGHRERFLPMGVPEDLMAIGGFDEDAIYEEILRLCRVDPPAPDDDWEDR